LNRTFFPAWFDIVAGITYKKLSHFQGEVAQLVEQRTENPCVGGSIPFLATIHRSTAFALSFRWQATSKEQSRLNAT
jgi:hypothetical protein